MPKRKKISREKKYQRRVLEANKALNKNTHIVSSTSETIISKQDQKKEESYRLPYQEIKRDLIKIILYAFVSLGALLIIDKTGFGFPQLISLIKS